MLQLLTAAAADASSCPWPTHLSAVDANPSSAAAIEPTVTAMCSQCRKVRSLAKNVLGSIFIGIVRMRGTSAPMMRSNHVGGGGPSCPSKRRSRAA